MGIIGDDDGVVGTTDISSKAGSGVEEIAVMVSIQKVGIEIGYYGSVTGGERMGS
jgi:hypothetical protein